MPVRQRGFNALDLMFSQSRLRPESTPFFPNGIPSFSSKVRALWPAPSFSTVNIRPLVVSPLVSRPIARDGGSTKSITPYDLVGLSSILPPLRPDPTARIVEIGRSRCLPSGKASNRGLSGHQLRWSTLPLAMTARPAFAIELTHKGSLSYGGSVTIGPPRSVLLCKSLQ